MTMIIFSLDVIRIMLCNVSFVFWSALHFFSVNVNIKLKTVSLSFTYPYCVSLINIILIICVFLFQEHDLSLLIWQIKKALTIKTWLKAWDIFEQYKPKCSLKIVLLSANWNHKSNRLIRSNTYYCLGRSKLPFPQSCQTRSVSRQAPGFFWMRGGFKD